MRNLLGVGVAVAVLCIVSQVQAHTFTTTTVDTNGNVGTDSTSIAFDSQGQIGVCYRDADNDRLGFASYDGAAWSTEVVDDDNGSGDNVGWHCALTYDANDVAHILYYNFTDNDLRHAKFEGGQWTIATADANIIGSFLPNGRISLAKDADGNLAAAYYDSSNRDLRYATRLNGVWATETVVANGDVGQYPSLAFDRDGNPAIAYLQRNNDTSAALMWVEHDGNAWQAPVQLDGNGQSGLWISLGFDSRNVAHLAYQQRDAQGYYTYYYRRRDAGQWSQSQAIQTSAQDAGGYTQIAVGPADNIHLFYRYYFRSALFGSANYLRMESIYFPEQGIDGTATHWQETLAFSVAPPRDFSGLTLAVDGAQRMAMAYTASNWDGSTQLVVKQLTNWRPAMKLTTPRIGDQTAADTFTFQWLDFDPDSNARLSFHYRDQQWQTLAFGETAQEDGANSVVVSTAAIPRGNYWAEARISDDDFATYYGVGASVELIINNHTPTTPALAGPAQGATLDDRTPALQWSNAGDVDGDLRTYDVQVATDQLFANVVVNQAGIAEAAGLATAWSVPQDLSDGVLYYWRVRARDSEDGLSAWAGARSFVIQVNDPPPTPVATAHTLTVHNGEVVWQNVVELDGDVVMYSVAFCADAACGQLLHAAGNIQAGNQGTSRFRAVSVLDPGNYFWRVRASDATGLTSAWSATAALEIQGEAPAAAAPAAQAPADEPAQAPAAQQPAANDGGAGDNAAAAADGGDAPADKGGAAAAADSGDSGERAAAGAGGSEQPASDAGDADAVADDGSGGSVAGEAGPDSAEGEEASSGAGTTAAGQSGAASGGAKAGCSLLIAQ
ncbi:MAG: hypothetical protein HY696_07920 [Deltaproteobacteria bacterium]|nr:hypothetical protein [Deltaproteobacteria bacterium]